MNGACALGSQGWRLMLLAPLARPEPPSGILAAGLPTGAVETARPQEAMLETPAMGATPGTKGGSSKSSMTKVVKGWPAGGSGVMMSGAPATGFGVSMTPPLLSGRLYIGQSLSMRTAGSNRGMHIGYPVRAWTVGLS